MKQTQFVVVILTTNNETKYLNYKSTTPKLVVQKRDASKFSYRAEAWVVGSFYTRNIERETQEWGISVIYPRGVND